MEWPIRPMYLLIIGMLIIGVVGIYEAFQVREVNQVLADNQALGNEMKAHATIHDQALQDQDINTMIAEDKIMKDIAIKLQTNDERGAQIGNEKQRAYFAAQEASAVLMVNYLDNEINQLELYKAGKYANAAAYAKDANMLKEQLSEQGVIVTQKRIEAGIPAPQ
jgi:hypothetical protein